MRWTAEPQIACAAPFGQAEPVVSPSDLADVVGLVTTATPDTVAAAVAAARPWDAPPAARRAVLDRAADALEAAHPMLFALLAREAGKTLPDAVAELREAVDFLRYYGAEATQLTDGAPRGRVAAIAPWNFPLAIFLGQVAAGLAAGNAVLAKPAPQTPLIAHVAIDILHTAGVPRSALQCLPGGATVGAALVARPGVDAVAFTGSTATAQAIHRSIADMLDPGAALIAETGGLNAMIVDSTALPEQAVQAIVESAFQSAGQRCSALRCLYLQDDIADTVLTMLTGAMDALSVGDPWRVSADLGPVIDAGAQTGIAAHIAQAKAEGRLLHHVPAPGTGHFVGPALIAVPGIAAIGQEVFGPVLHVARYKAGDLDAVIDAINATGYGLTFGLQTRIDARVQHVADRIAAGNLYVNRNQIGAVVGSQPFGGEGLSGTGPKAGGPLYLHRLRRRDAPVAPGDWAGPADEVQVQAALDTAIAEPASTALALPGPTGEANQYNTAARPPILCLGPGPDAARAQARAVGALGGVAVLADGQIAPDALSRLTGFGGVLWWGDAQMARALRRALAGRDGPILPLITALPDAGHALCERHLCIDTTAAGGNAALLSGDR